MLSFPTKGAALVLLSLAAGTEAAAPDARPSFPTDGFTALATVTSNSQSSSGTVTGLVQFVNSTTWKACPDLSAFDFALFNQDSFVPSETDTSQLPVWQQTTASQQHVWRYYSSSQASRTTYDNNYVVADSGVPVSSSLYVGGPNGYSSTSVQYSGITMGLSELVECPPAATSAPTPKPPAPTPVPLPLCTGDRNTWNYLFSKCPTFAAGGLWGPDNGNGCGNSPTHQHNGRCTPAGCAQAVCSECGFCVDP